MIQKLRCTMIFTLLFASAAAAQASSPGTLTYNGSTLELKSALGVFDSERSRFKIWLLPFEPSATELDKLLHDEAFWMDDDRPSPDPARYNRVPYAHYSMNWSFEPADLGKHDKAYLFIFTSGLDGDYGQLNINLLPGEAEGNLQGALKAGDEIVLKAKDEYTMDEHHVTWDLDLKVVVHEKQIRQEPVQEEEQIQRSPEQMPLVGTNPTQKAAIKELEEKYGEASILTFPWALNPRSPGDLRRFLEAGIPVDAMIEINQGEESMQLSPLQYTLSFACEGDDTAEVVRILVENGADVNRRDPIKGGTVLMQVAMWEKCASLVDLLLKAGANPNLRNNDDETAMTRAVRNGSLEQMKMLIDGGFDVARDRQELMEIARHSPEKQVLLSSTAGQTSTPATSPEPAKPEIKTLEEALDKIDVKAASDLLAEGASVEIKVDDEPPLIYLTDACRWKDTTLLATLTDLMLEHGANVHTTGGPLQSTPLALAAAHCPVGMVKALLAAGADPNVQDVSLKTPLFAAVFANRPEVVDVLLDAGAKVDRDAKFFAKSKPEIEQLIKKKRKK